MARRVNRLSEEQLARVLELGRKSDSVELKLTVPASDHREAIVALGLDPLEAQIRQVFFFDTPDLTLNGAGVFVRETPSSSSAPSSPTTCPRSCDARAASPSKSTRCPEATCAQRR